MLERVCPPQHEPPKQHRKHINRQKQQGNLIMKRMQQRILLDKKQPNASAPK
jgi:hypothetical protein